MKEKALVTYMAYTSVLLTASKEPYGGLAILIRHFLQLKGLYSNKDHYDTCALSFPEWLSITNKLEANHQGKQALCEILLKTARYQVKHGMNQANVLFAFSDFDRIKRSSNP